MAKVYVLKRRGRHRNSRLHFLHHVQEWLWPSMGLKRFSKWAMLKIIRHGKSAHSLALGFAFGAVAIFVLQGKYATRSQVVKGRNRGWI